MPTNRWLQEARKDHYRRRAREEGYRSRAAYKFLEAQRKYRLVKRGDIIVDLGAWPGGISQALARIVGSEGLVIAVDRRKFKKFDERNIITLQLDILEDDVVSEIKKILDGKLVDFLISDASPSFSGIRDVDVLRQIELTERSHEIAKELVRRGGSVMLKALECGELRELERELKTEFKIVKRFIPKATRKSSSELYLIGIGKLV